MPVPFGCQYVQERDAEDPGKHASYELRSGQCYQDQVASSSFARQGRYRCQCCFAGKIQRVNSRDGSQLPVTGSSFSASPPMLRFRFLNVFRSNLLHADHSCVRLLVAKRRSASWDEFGHSTSPAILAGLASRRISRCYGALASLGQFCHGAAGKIQSGKCKRGCWFPVPGSPFSTSPLFFWLDFVCGIRKLLFSFIFPN